MSIAIVSKSNISMSNMILNTNVTLHFYVRLTIFHSLLPKITLVLHLPTANGTVMNQKGSILHVF